MAAVLTLAALAALAACGIIPASRFCGAELGAAVYVDPRISLRSIFTKLRSSCLRSSKVFGASLFSPAADRASEIDPCIEEREQTHPIACFCVFPMFLGVSKQVG